MTLNSYCFCSVCSACLRERHRVLAHHADLAGIEAHDDVAVGDRHELVDRVEQVELIEGRLVERVSLERALQGHARARLVAGSQQVRAQIRVGARVLGVERQRTAHERRPPRRSGSCGPGDRRRLDRPRRSSD